MRLLLYSLVSSSFLVFLRCSLLIFSFISTCLMVSASNTPKYLVVYCSSVLIFNWFGSSIPSVMCRSLLFIISMGYFSMPNSIPLFRLYFLATCVRGSDSFSFLANSLMPSMLFCRVCSGDESECFPMLQGEYHSDGDVMLVFDDQGWKKFVKIFLPRDICSAIFLGFWRLLRLNPHHYMFVCLSQNVA